MRSVFLISGLAISAGCSSDSYLVVTVEAQPAIHEVAKLEVTRFGEDPPQVQTLALLNFKFPVTFSISGVGQSGTLDLGVKALSVDDVPLGAARSQLSLDASEATMVLEAADFVVNSDFEDDQFLTEENDSVGRQLTSTVLGDWTLAFNTTCSACDLFGRRYNAAGEPLFSSDADGPIAFRVTTRPSQRGSATPAIASSKLNSIIVWDFADLTDGASGVACRGLDERGSATAGQLVVSSETATGVDVAPLPDGNFAVTWLAQQLNSEVHMMTVRPDCTTPMAAPIIISTPERERPRGAHVASNDTALLYGWILGASTRLRAGTADGMLLDGFQIDPPPGSTIEQVRLAPMGTGFAVALRVASINRAMPGSIILYRTNATGALLPGPPTLITDQSGSNTSTGRVGFGIATRGDGATLVVWHQCDDGSSAACSNRLDVYGRVVRADGTVVGEPFSIPTTTEGNQRNPSVTAIDGAFAVAWTDESMASPDTSGSAVRARLIYPTF